MSKLTGCGMILILAGCAGGVTKEELETVKQQLQARDDQMAAKLTTDLTGVEGKYATVKELQIEVREQLKKMNELHAQLTALSGALDAKIDLATANVIRAMEFEERLMTDRLAQLRSMIQELKEPKKE